MDDADDTVVVRIEYLYMLGESHVISPAQMAKYSHRWDAGLNIVVEWVLADSH